MSLSSDSSPSPAGGNPPPGGIEGGAATRPPTWLLRSLWWGAPILLCLILMAPRLASPQFGLLDDGLTLQQAGRILGGSWGEAISVQVGRLRPMYWLFPTAVYALWGPEPFWFFAVNALMLAALTAELMWLVRLEGGSRLQASTTGLLFALAGPTIEAFYTLSKGEGLQLTLLILSLVCTASYGRSRKGWRRRLGIFGAATAGLLALLTKETSIVLLPLSLVWLLLEWPAARRGAAGPRLAARKALFAASLVGLPILLLIVRGQLAASQGIEVHTSGYQFSASGFIASAIRIAGWLLRDFPYLIPLGLVLLVLYLRARIPRWPLLLEGLLWVGAWTAVFLPWPFIDEYYLLPTAAGAAIVAGAAVDAAWASRRSLGPWSRGGVFALLALGLAGLLTTFPNNLTSARIQLAVDGANGEALRRVAEEIPQGGRLLVNLQNPREYFDMIRIFLTQQLGRPDLQIEALDPEKILSLPSEGHGAYVLSPVVSGTPYFTVRVGVGPTEAQAWDAALLQSAGDQLALIYQTHRQFSRLNIDLPAALCPVLQRSVYCSVPRPVINSGEFSFGWNLYEVTGP